MLLSNALGQGSSGSNSLKNASISAFTAGALNYADTNWFEGASPANGSGAQVTTAGPVQNPGYSSEWLSWQKAQDAVVRSGTHAVIESGISTAVNGGSLQDNLGSALVSQGFDLTAAVGNKNLGDFADHMDLSPGSAEKVFLHAMLGGALSAARGGDFKTGAIAAGAAEGLTAVASDNLGKYHR